MELARSIKQKMSTPGATYVAIPAEEYGVQQVQYAQVQGYSENSSAAEARKRKSCCCCATVTILGFLLVFFLIFRGPTAYWYDGGIPNNSTVTYTYQV